MCVKKKQRDGFVKAILRDDDWTDSGSVSVVASLPVCL